MPPKAKFNRNEIISAAVQIVRETGFKSLTARSLAFKLNSSSRPIFTIFSSMEEVEQATYQAIYDLYNKYVSDGLKKAIPFKGTGEAYIFFAIEEPKLFQALFMKEQTSKLTINNVLQSNDKDYEAEITLIQDQYGLQRKEAHDLYLHMWIFSHGAATLAATKVCSFTKQDVSDLLSKEFLGQIQRIKHK